MMFSGIQMKVWTFMIQRDLMIPSLIIFDDPKGISIGSMDFDNPKVYGDTSIFDGLVLLNFAFLFLFVLLFMLCLGGMGRSFNHNHSTHSAPFLGSLGSMLMIFLFGQESSKSNLAGTGISQCWHSFV